MSSLPQSRKSSDIYNAYFYDGNNFDFRYNFTLIILNNN